MAAMDCIGLVTKSWLVVVALALAGIGMGVASPACVASVANSVPEADLGVEDDLRLCCERSPVLTEGLYLRQKLLDKVFRNGFRK